MAERTFDYEAISQIYNDMKSITENISTTLTDADTYVTDKVNVCEEAIFGDLGSTLKLDWDNFSSGFPNFVNEFQNWATVVATANNEYSQFEQDVQGFRSTHAYGVAEAGGMTDGFVNTGYYSNAHTADEITNLQNAAQFYALTGTTYTDTGMVAIEKKSRFWNAVGDIVNVAAIVASGVSILNSVKAISAANSLASYESQTVSGVTKNVVSQATKDAVSEGMTEVGYTGTRTAGQISATAINSASRAGASAAGKVTSVLGTGKIASGISGAVGTGAKVQTILSWAGNSAVEVSTNAFATGVLHAAGVASPLIKATAGGAVACAGSSTITRLANSSRLNNANSYVGSTYAMNGNTYTYCGTTSSGSNIYADANNNLVYKASDGTMQYVTDANNTTVTVDTLDDTSSLYIGGTDVGSPDDMTSIMNVNEVVTEVEDYGDYLGALNVSTFGTSN